MTTRPTRATPGGRAYLDLRKVASAAGRPTDELLQLYALEGLLDRLSGSPHADRFVLKGGVLLAAFDARRPTRDIDLAAIDVTNNLDDIRALINDVLAAARDD
ncbi:MAG TPA: nucleotidyl transferase AbiEii/AbiGii toxin family protein, partial [Aeromicrobium sp.]|nr:nucleotidyl transferase AbiEii/AbiGii toxin family protein [Aeromicrobium sp.]